MTAFNREKYIAEAIESVLLSTYDHFELIIVDDCSTDNSFNIAEKYAAGDARIKTFRNHMNIGQFANRNRAASLATGSIYFYADSDDLVEPDALEYIVNEFEKFPTADFATLYFGTDIEEATVIDRRKAIRKNYLDNEFLIIGPPGTAIRAGLFNALGGFSLKYGPVDDCYYNVMAAYYSNVILLPRVFFKYRRHEDQVKDNSSRYDFLLYKYRIFQDTIALPDMPFSESEKKALVKRKKRMFLIYCLVYIKDTKKIIPALRLMHAVKIGIRDLSTLLLRRKFLNDIT
jgi:glycosyltransferase involved in cell wall biosynthesis